MKSLRNRVIIVTILSLLLATPLFAQNNTSIKHRGEYFVGTALSGKYSIEDESYYSSLYRPMVEFKHGLIIDDVFYVGASISMQCYFGRISSLDLDSEKWNTIAFPLAINLKGFIPLQHSIKPYVSVSSGYPLVATSECNIKNYQKLIGRYYFEAGAGFQYKSLLCEVGYQFNSNQIKIDRVLTEPIKHGSFYLKIGIAFE